MGTLTASQILDDIQQELLEGTPDGSPGSMTLTPGIYWPRIWLFNKLNEAMEQISAVRRDAYVITGAYQLIAGVQQTIDPDAGVLISLQWNLGQNGDTIGPPITPTNKELMNRVQPGWTLDTPESNVIHYMYDLDQPRFFEVWPPVPVQGSYVQAQQSFITPTLTDETQTIPLEDTWSLAIKAYVLWWAHYKNTDRAVPAKGDQWSSVFSGEIGAEEAARVKVQPGTKKET